MELLRAALWELVPYTRRDWHRAALFVSFLLAASPILFGVSGYSPAAAVSLRGPFGATQIGAPTPTVTALLPPVSVDAARLFNASMRIDAYLPLEPAKPFVLVGSPEDKQRALTCLTQAVYYEAGYEPLAGRRGVAQVVLNRVRHPAFPNSVCGVVYQGSGSAVCQFTFVCDGSLQRRPVPKAWREAESVALAALHGYVEGEVGEATHYHADYVAPNWAPLLAKVAIIGQHIFYRWPGAAGERAAFSARYEGEANDMLVTAALPGTPSDAAAAEQPPVVEAAAIPRIGYDIAALLTPTAAKETAAR